MSDKRQILTLEDGLSILKKWADLAEEGTDESSQADAVLAKTLLVGLLELRDRIEVLEGVTRKGGIVIPGPCVGCAAPFGNLHANDCPVLAIKESEGLEEDEAQETYSRRVCVRPGNNPKGLADE